MFFISFFRAVKFSLQDIGRDIWLSLVTVIILILALFTINMLLVVQVISQTAIEAVKEKIDISLYLKPEAEEDKILALKAKISNLTQVKSVQYISKNEALEIFQEKHKRNPEILAALRELGQNPLTPTLVIQPKTSAQYEELAHIISGIEDDIIEANDFDTANNSPKLALEKINSITDKVREIGLVISAIFVLITVLVVYNAVRIAIYTHKRGITIMKLVGASNTFIRSPYLISSLIYTLVGLALTLLIFYPFLSLLQPYLEVFFIGYNINIITYFNSHFFQIFGLEFLGIAVINSLASLIAVSKYSRV